MPAGHPGSITPEIVALLVKYLKTGCPYSTACAAASIYEGTFYDWMRLGRDATKMLATTSATSKSLSPHRLKARALYEAVKKATAEGEVRNLGLIAIAAQGTPAIKANKKKKIQAVSRVAPDWHAAAWLLERRKPHEYSLHANLRKQASDDTTDIFAEAAKLSAIMYGTMRGVPAPDGVLPKAWTTFRWTKEQLTLLDDNRRFILLDCGRGSGKTHIAICKTIIESAVKREWDDPLLFYAAPTNPQAIRVGWNRLVKMFPPQWIADVKRTEQCIETIFGSKVYVFGMDVPARAEGDQWSFGVLDECSDQKPDAFDLSIAPALTHREGACWRVGVPKRTGNGAARFREACEAARDGDGDTKSYTWPSSDVLPKHVIENFQHRLDPKDFREQFGANWETAGGGIFWAFDEEQNVKPCRYDPTRPLTIGMDFNVDPMAWVIGHRYVDRIEWLDEIFKHNTHTAECGNILWQRYQDHNGGFEFFGDASSKARHTSATTSDYAIIVNDRRFKEAPGGRNAYIADSNPPVADRFAACNAMFLNAANERRMFIDPHCRNLIADCKARAYKEGTSIPADRSGGKKGSKDIGHITDGMGYPVYACFPIELELDSGVPTVIIGKGG